MSIQALNEFDKSLLKAKSFGTIMSNVISSYRTLKEANLSNYHQKLIKVTICNL